MQNSVSLQWTAGVKVYSNYKMRRNERQYGKRDASQSLIGPNLQ
jgi:hypothetical protein